MIMKGFLKEYNSITPSQFLNPDLQYKSSPRQTKKTTVSPQVKENLWEVQFSSSLTNLHKERCQEGNYTSSSKRSERSSFLVLSHTHTKATSTFHFLILAHDFFYTCTCIFTKTHHFTWSPQQALSCKLDMEFDAHLKIKRKWKFNLCKKILKKH